jgi:hypothetical protein
MEDVGRVEGRVRFGLREVFDAGAAASEGTDEFAAGLIL